MINIKGGDPQDYHEGDMADEIVERDLHQMPMSHIIEWAYKAYEAEVKSWPPEVIRKRYLDMTGGDA